MGKRPVKSLIFIEGIKHEVEYPAPLLVEQYYVCFTRFHGVQLYLLRQ